jgi:hypothetical protein
MAKTPSPLANMLSQAAGPPPSTGVPFKQGVATPPPKPAGKRPVPPQFSKHTMPPTSGHTMPAKKAPPKSGPGGGSRGGMANFGGKHAPPFAKKGA